MKTVLLINGCPRREHSRTRNLAYAYLDGRKQAEHITILERDLCKERIQYMTHMSFDSTTGNPLPMDSTLAEEFASADEIVLAAPFWEFLFPAVVSCYFECISIAGVTFQYTQTGSEGLCKATKFTYIYTAGAYLKKEDKLCEQYLRQLMNLYGIPEFSAILVDGLDIETNNANELVDAKCKELR
ncbi:MAG: NAD(P)H-dependent oxidoreductase [Eubacteriales bacterium]